VRHCSNAFHSRRHCFELSRDFVNASSFDVDVPFGDSVHLNNMKIAGFKIINH